MMKENKFDKSVSSVCFGGDGVIVGFVDGDVYFLDKELNKIGEL